MSERKVKLPGIPAPTASNLAQVVRLLVERAEVREGARGDELEAVVTRRDLAGSGFVVLRGNSANGGVLVQGPGGEATLVPIDAFGDQLRKTAAYQSLLTRLDDINRFANLPDRVRALLAEDLALEAARRQADIQRIDHKSQSATESLAYALQVVTAAVAGASAGVREVTFASATANTATAGQITQLQARLNGVAINPVDILPTVYATLAALQAAVPVGAQGK